MMGGNYFPLSWCTFVYAFISGVRSFSSSVSIMTLFLLSIDVELVYRYGEDGVERWVLTLTNGEH